MAQNDNTSVFGTHNVLHWILALAILALICLKGYENWQVIKLRQHQVELTQNEKAEQDSINVFIERGKMACRVCDDYEKNNQNRITDSQIAFIVIGVILFVGGIFAWAFKDFY